MRTILLMMLAASVSFAEDALTRKLAENGLPAKITITVRTEDGHPIENASVKFVFDVQNQRHPKIVETNTDNNGMASGEGCANVGIVIHVDKDGFYGHFSKYNVWRAGGDAYKSGRWEPWNPMIDIVMMEKKNPQKHCQRHINTIYHLTQERAYGFDLLSNRIVVPGSQEGHADFYFHGTGSFYESDMKHDGPWEKHDVFTFNFAEDGFITMKRNMESHFAFIHEAPLVGYENPVVFFLSRVDSSQRKPYPSNSTEFIVFRVSRKNEESGELESYFGIIQSLSYSKNWDNNEPFFSIEYRINTTPNDRNIEYN